MSKTSKRNQKLVILDLDDLLVKRHRGKTVDEITQLMDTLNLDGPKNQLMALPRFTLELRSNLPSFFRELFKRCRVAIWTSATRENATNVVKSILTKEQRGQLLFSWSRDECALDPSYDPALTDSEIKFYSTIKPFTRIVESPAINEKRTWNQDNVLIIDNSELKLRFNPESTKLVWPDFACNIMDVFNHPFFRSEEEA